MTAPAVYTLSLHTPSGLFISDLRGVMSFSLAKAIGEGGAGTLVFPYSTFLRHAIQREYIVDIQRNGKRLLDQLWIVKRLNPSYTEKGEAILTLGVIDLARLIAKQRLSPYYAGSSQSKRTGYLDDMCKAIITDNHVSPTDTTRIIPNLTVAANVSKAPSDSKAFAYRDVGDVLREICNLSTQAGTYLAWDVVCTQSPGMGSVGFEFRTYTGQRGNDHRYPNGEQGALWLSPENSTISGASVDEDYTEERNAVYAGGRLEGENRKVKTAVSAAASASLYARSELFVNASSMTGAEDDAFVQAEANAALIENKARVTFEGTLTPTENCQFDVHYGFGDFLTAQAFDSAYDFHLDALSIGYTLDGGEKIKSALMVEA